MQGMLSDTPTIDEGRLEKFLEHVAVEAGAAANAALVLIGDELGLYRAMADGRPVSSAELAGRTGTHERYVREWLATQAASGFVTYDPESAEFTLPPEHALALADEASPVAQIGLFQSVVAIVRSHERILEAFRTGDGVAWHEHDHALFHGVERLFAATYRRELVADWLPALDGVVERLQDGAHVADIGAGHGNGTIELAQAFPQSTFAGFDNHAESVAVARERAWAAGVADRVTFEVAPADAFPGRYDLVTTFDALHDMGDPVGAARRVRSALGDDGTWIVIEPLAGDRLEDNLHPLGRLLYAYSTLLCTPGSLAQDGALGLGTQAGPARLSEVIRAGGFTRVRVAHEGPANLVIEARP
jgi:SAM-dependent methyltransferase